MTLGSATLRSAADSTFKGLSVDHARTVLLRSIVDSWQHTENADLVAALRQHPQLLRERSLLLNLAIQEYSAKKGKMSSIDLAEHCRRFREFGSSIEHSVLRQLEAQRYIDAHPELLGLLTPPNWPQIGDQFANFRILEELGSGASAKVYLASQGDIGNRQVVVKISPIPSAEAAVLGRLDHPHIVPIHSQGYVEEYDLYYLCMPFCGRSTLVDLLDLTSRESAHVVLEAANRWIKDGDRITKLQRRALRARIDLSSFNSAVLKLALQIADALDHAHGERILHGDLKASNVLLTPDGDAILLDFNLSHEFMGAPRLLGGTLPYMPPEALRQVVFGESAPQSSEFDPKADIFSFGAMLHELFTGTTPVALPDNIDDTVEVAELLIEQLREGISPIQKTNRLVSNRLQSTILSCLAFDPDDRPASMKEVLHSLEAETKFVPVLHFQRRSRPLRFALVLATIFSATVGSVALVASRPPRYLATYETGLQHVASGRLHDAIECFSTSTDSNPEFLPARFELGRARVALGQLDLAMTDFYKLADENGHSLSMAYMAYCLNLKGAHLVAIPWYERAIQNQAKSASIYNNLGACYLIARGTASRSQQLQNAEQNLYAALNLDRTSSTIRLNLVRLASKKSARDPSYDPSTAWQHAEYVLNAAPPNRLIKYDLAVWYEMVRERETAGNSAQGDQLSRIARKDRSGRDRFESLRDELALHRLNGAPDIGEMDLVPAGKYEPHRHPHFLEPSLPDGRQPI